MKTPILFVYLCKNEFWDIHDMQIRSFSQQVFVE